MPPKLLPGVRDFYPEQFAERAHIFETWRRIVRRYAFQEYDGPPLEPLELYTQKSGDEIVGQLFEFVDKGGRAVAMRPEMTPTFARMVGARAQPYIFRAMTCGLTLIHARVASPARIEVGGPLRMVRRQTWSGRERSSHSRAELVPKSGSPL